MKNLAIILIIVIIAAGAFFALRKTIDTTPLESAELNFLVGTNYKADKNDFEKTDNFEANKDKVYFIISTKKALEADTPFNVVVKSVATTETLSTLTINSNEKEIKRAINPVNVTIPGKYVVEVIKGDKAVVRKVINVIEAAPGSPTPAPAAPIAPAPAAPVTPATGEVKVEAPAVPTAVTGEVQPK